MPEVLSSLGAELAVTAIAFALGVLAQKVRSRLAQRRLEARCPVAGTYFSWYEDETDGRAFTDKALIELEQKGDHFTGRTWLSGTGDREWQLRGEILEGRHLSGVYYHTDPSDPGRGMFFLEPRPGEQDSYEGIWAGYDAINRKVTSGRYRWRRQLDVEVRPLDVEQEQELTESLAVLAHALGDRYVSRDDVREVATSSSGVALIATDPNGDILGVCLGEVLDDDEVGRYRAELRQHARLPGGFDALRIGRLSTVAVKPRARGYGVAARLASACLEGLRGQGCGAVLAVSWVHEGDTSHGVLAAAGFEQLVEIERYWRSDSIDRDYDCPTCGNPCACNAILMMARL